MKKILITGFSGFVSSHFIQYLEKEKIHAEILGIDLSKPDFNFNNSDMFKVHFKSIDLLDNDQLQNIIYSFQPEYILHLASYSSVGFSWKNPSLSFRNNIDIFLNMMEIIRKISPKSRILSIGSSEEYGNVKDEMIPLKEEYNLNPISPYAVARVSQEHLSKVYSDGYGLDIVMTRSFNHIGPGQRDNFVISSFAKQLVEIKKNLKKDNKLITGDVTIIRDFLDVRDVVDSYYRLLLNGKKGEVYNICSGEGISLKEIIEMMCGILDVKVGLETDPDLIRPNDNRKITGSNDKLIKATGWKRNISLKQSLIDIINYWNEKI